MTITFMPSTQPLVRLPSSVPPLLLPALLAVWLAVPAAGIPAGGRGEGVVSGKDLVEQLLGIKDSSERSAFYRKHREALLAASREERQRLG